MLSHAINRFIDRQRWLEPVADFLQKAVGGFYKLLGAPGHGLKTFIHGTWLGHPLHPVITDIPLGAWTLAVLNTVVLVVYLVSWLIRLTGGSRGLAIVLAFIGYALVICAAYLGGEMVFSIGTGVNHHAWQPVPEKFTKVLLEGRMTEGMLVKAMAGDTPILLFKKGDTVCAISETCSHAGGPLSEGELLGNLVQCPWHASRFDICTGQVRGGPATISQVRYETRIQNGQIEVRRSEDTLQPN